MAVDVLEGLLEEDDEVVQVSNEMVSLLFLSNKKWCSTVVLFCAKCSKVNPVQNENMAEMQDFIILQWYFVFPAARL